MFITSIALFTFRDTFRDTDLVGIIIIIIIIIIRQIRYSRSSRKRPPREFRKVVATRASRSREWALVSDHMMKQQRVVAYKSFQRKAWHRLMVTNNFVVIILNSFLLPITEEVRVGTRQRTISACVMCYCKFEQEPTKC